MSKGIRAKDVFYEPRTPVDSTRQLELLDGWMDIQDMTDMARVVFTINLRIAMDDAYEEGMRAANE